MHLILISDNGNNLGRRCDVLGVRKDSRRGWTVTAAYAECQIPNPARVPSVVTHYALSHDDGSTMVAPRDHLGNLY